MVAELSVGAIREIRVNGTNCVEFPVVQCLSTKSVGEAPNLRFRAIISDSETFIQSMFSTGLNERVESGEISKNSILTLDEYTVNTVKDRVIMIVHQVTVVEQHDEKIGQPAAVEAFLQGQAEAEQADEQQKANAGATNGKANGNAYQAGAAKGGAGGGGAGNARGGNNAGAAAGRGGGAGASSSGQQHPIYPIEGLSPYQNKWTIKARITNKSDIRHWSNQKGEGKLFSCTLLDDTGEIKMTGFNDAVDNFYNVLQEGKVYFISKARVGIAKKQFSNVNNEYEITLETQSEISLCTDTDNVPQVKYNFVQLGSLDQVEANSMCDVIGVVKDVGDISQIVSKATQKPITKRELTLVDMTGMSVRLTLWGRQAENFNAAGDDGAGAPVIAFKGVKVGDFGGRSLSMVSSSSMSVDPDIEEAHELRGWYDNQGSSTTFTAFTSANAGGAQGGAGASMRPENFKLIGDAKDSMLGAREEPDFFCVRGPLVHMKKDNISYPACPTCSKKMSLEDTDSWRCEKCDRTYPAPEYRYVLSTQVADFTGFLYVSGFNEVGQLFLGKTADEMERLKSEDEASYNGVFDRAMGKFWDLSIKARSESYNDQQKIRYQILKASPAQFTGEPAKRLIAAIESYD